MPCADGVRFVALLAHLINQPEANYDFFCCCCFDSALLRKLRRLWRFLRTAVGSIGKDKKCTAADRRDKILVGLKSFRGVCVCVCPRGCKTEKEFPHIECYSSRKITDYYDERDWGMLIIKQAKMYTTSGAMLIVRLPVFSKTQTVLQNNNKKRSKTKNLVLRAKTVQNGKQNKQYAMQLIADITTIVLRAADVDGPAEG